MGILSFLGLKQPKAPDPNEVARTQYGYNQQALLDSLRRGAIGQKTPFGGVSYERDASGVPTGQTVTLSPAMQEYYDNLFGQAGAASGGVQDIMGRLSGGVDTSGVPGTSDIAQTSFDRQMTLLDPRLDEAKTQLDVAMANRGIPVGSEIWDREQDRYDTARNTALTQAARTADLDATTEQQRLIGNELAEFGANTSAMGTMAGVAPNLMGVTPTAMQTPWMQASPGNYANAAQSKYKADAANYRNSMTGAANVISAGLGFFSDEDLKEDRAPADGETILSAFRNMPVDDYRYKDEAQAELELPEHRTGPMAQDYAERFPEGSDGSKIDMGDMVGKLLAAVKALDARTDGLRQPH